ncbi:hypothetical protein KXW64_007667 [Aspergillus fumigatus]|nr:hypothetical protein KXW64_007667 [Aspergillus fumigatus]
MAKGSNTWCKKLMNKQKRHAMRFTRKPHALTFSLAEQVKAEASFEARRKSPKEYLAPTVKGFNPGRGRKGTLSREYRAMVEARNAKREAFFAGV